MTLQSILSTIVLAGALLAPPVHASGAPVGTITPDGRTPTRHDDAPVQPDPSGRPAIGVETPEGRLIQGRIAAVELESGHFVLDTDEGPISLVTSPAELVGVKVGDVVRVALTSAPRRP